MHFLHDTVVLWYSSPFIRSGSVLGSNPAAAGSHQFLLVPIDLPVPIDFSMRGWKARRWKARRWKVRGDGKWRLNSNIQLQVAPSNNNRIIN